MDPSNCPWSFPFQFLRMLWCVLSLGHSLIFYLRFLTGPWIFVSSDMIFEYLLFISFPNVSHSFTSIHKTWTYLNLFFRFSTILRMLGWVYESHFKMLYMLFCQLFYSLHPSFDGSSLHTWSRLFWFMKIIYFRGVYNIWCLWQWLDYKLEACGIWVWLTQLFFLLNFIGII